MSNDKPRKLKDVLPPVDPDEIEAADRAMKARADRGLLEARQGANDAKWFLIEHQLSQAQVSLSTVRLQCESVGDHPENSDEWELARATLEIVSPVYVRLLGAIASVHSLLSGTEVAERVGRKEL